METVQVETKASTFLTIAGVFLIVTSIAFTISDTLIEAVGDKCSMIILLTSFFGGMSIMKGFRSYIYFTDNDRKYIKAFHDAKEYLKTRQLNNEIVDELKTCNEEKTKLETQLNNCKLEVKRLESQGVNLKAEIASITNSFKEYRDSFPSEKEMQDCQSINRVLVTRTQMLSKLISQNDSKADSYKVLKERLDLLLLILKGKIPKNINGNDFQVQQIMGQQVWGLCKDLKDSDSTSVPTDWQSPESTVRSSGGISTKGNSPKFDMNMKGP